MGPHLENAGERFRLLAARSCRTRAAACGQVNIHPASDRARCAQVAIPSKTQRQVLPDKKTHLVRKVRRREHLIASIVWARTASLHATGRERSSAMAINAAGGSARRMSRGGTSVPSAFLSSMGRKTARASSLATPIQSRKRKGEAGEKGQ